MSKSAAKSNSSGRTSFATQLEQHESVSLGAMRDFGKKWCTLNNCLHRDNLGDRMAICQAVGELWSLFNSAEAGFLKGQALLDYLWTHWEPPRSGRKRITFLWRLPGYVTGTICQKCWGFAAGFLDKKTGNMNATFQAMLSKFNKGHRHAGEQKITGSNVVDKKCNKQDKVLRFLKQWVVYAQDHIPEDVSDQHACYQTIDTLMPKEGRVTSCLLQLCFVVSMYVL